MKINKIYITIGLIVGILLLINVLSEQFSLRLDFTEDKQYTLSKATKDILKELEEPVTVKAYFSENLPPNIVQTRKDFKDLLIEYSSLSHGMVVYEFIHPNEDEKKEAEALQNGIQPVMINVREKDQMKQQKAFMGAIIELGEQKEVIPFMQPGAAMEYTLSTSIKKLTVTDKPSIGLLQGHGEPSLSELQQVHEGLGILYNIEPITLNDTAPIPDYYKTIALIAPKDSFPQTHLEKLDEFLSRGGYLFTALNRVSGDLSTTTGSSVSTGVETWLLGKGIEISDQFIVDMNCGAVTVQQQKGFFSFANNISFPYLPVITNFSDHPVTKGLESVLLPFASPIRYIGDTTKKFTPIASTSGKAALLKAPLYFNIQKRWTEADFPLSNIPVAGVLEGNFGKANKASKIIVIADGDFAVNGQRGKGMNLQPDNVSLVINSIDWLSDDTGLINLRTKGITSKPIEQLEDSTKAMLKYTNFLLPILLIVIYGIIRMQIKQNIRVKRMEENYE